MVAQLERAPTEKALSRKEWQLCGIRVAAIMYLLNRTLSFIFFPNGIKSVVSLSFIFRSPFYLISFFFFFFLSR
jgi:hypothetical protein